MPKGMLRMCVSSAKNYRIRFVGGGLIRFLAINCPTPFSKSRHYEKLGHGLLVCPLQKASNL